MTATSSSRTDAPLLTARDIVAGYQRDLPIVNGAGIELRAGEIAVVLGPNGAGKSTLVKAIAGLVPISSGSVVLGDADITHLPAHRKIAAGLAFVPQTENVFATMTIDDNLLLAAAVLPKAQRHARCQAMYEMFPDLARQKRLPAGRLSGGQRQMLAIARALMVGPRVLLLDEPSAGLSPKLVAGVFADLARIRDSGVGIVLVEQNARAALSIGDRAYVLVEGRNRHQGPAAGLADDPLVAALYLGHRPAAATTGVPA
ncbi:MAG TPA: ABC transporter ATP-binding protein [Dongiaceae bacterium]|nr:ABC transporter ATP-binding protein [Dongiaceae bacterium]